MSNVDELCERLEIAPCEYVKVIDSLKELYDGEGRRYSVTIECPDCGATLRIESDIPLSKNVQLRFITHNG